MTVEQSTVTHPGSGGEATPVSAPISLEGLLLENIGIAADHQFPRELRPFIKSVVVIDALEIPIGVTHKKSLLVYSVWQDTGSFPEDLGALVREDEEGMRLMIDEVLGNEGLDVYLDQIEELRSTIVRKWRNGGSVNELRSIVRNHKKQKMLEGDGSNIANIASPDVGFPRGEDEFFSSHPEALEVLALKQGGLSHPVIAQRLGRGVANIHDLSRALVFFKKIKPPRSQEERVREYDEFLRGVWGLREEGLSVKEIADSLESDPRRVVEANKFLLWMKITTKKDRREVLLKRYGRDQHVSMLTEYLGVLPENQTLNLRRAHVEFCFKFGIEISYDKFISMYHQIENEKSVPPTKLTSRDRVRELMIEEIARIRTLDPNATIFVGELCRRLGVNEDIGQIVFNTIDNTGLSNTKKGREEGKARVLAILTRLAETTEEANLTAVASEAGVSIKLVYRVYHQMEGVMPLPEIKRRGSNSSAMSAIIFTSS